MSKKFIKNITLIFVLSVIILGTNMVHAVKYVFLEMEEADIKSLGVPRRLIFPGGGREPDGGPIQHNPNLTNLKARFSINDKSTWNKNQNCGISLNKLGAMKDFTVFGELPFTVGSEQSLEIRLIKKQPMGINTLSFSLR